MFSLMEHMPGHEFIPFALDFDQNLDTPYRGYFLAPPGGNKNVYFSQFNLSLSERFRFAIDMVYHTGARKKLEELIKATRPDVALFLNAVYFSDSIIDACRKYEIPIIWRLSDFHKICASYLLYRDDKVCEDCLEKGIFQCVVNRCGGYQRSLGAAAVKYLSMTLSRLRNSYDHVRYFVAPSQFTRAKMIQGGFNASKVICIPTFVKTRDVEPKPCSNPHKVLYVGRLSAEKGVEILIKAFMLLRNKNAVLTIVGDMNNAYARSLDALVDKDFRSRIDFVGYKNQEEVLELYQDHALFVVPSICYENLPNVVLEGMMNARPPLVSRLGSLIETVEHGKTGYHFNPGDPQDLAERIDDLLEHQQVAQSMGFSAYEYVTKMHSPETHVHAMESLFQKSIE